jgi:phage terminase small subunit
MAELERRQERYCVEYVNDPKRNQTQAAIRAGYSEKSARITASVHMKNPNILQRIRELEKEKLEEAGHSPDSVRPFSIRQLVDIVRTNATDIVEVIYIDDAKRAAALEQIAKNNGGQYELDFGYPVVYVKPTVELTCAERSAVKSIKMGRYGIEIEMHDKLAALKALADIAGITKQSLELSGPGGQALELNLNFAVEQIPEDAVCE